jgi:hypothetical protein
MKTKRGIKIKKEEVMEGLMKMGKIMMKMEIRSKRTNE